MYACAGCAGAWVQTVRSRRFAMSVTEWRLRAGRRRAACSGDPPPRAKRGGGGWSWPLGCRAACQHARHGHLAGVADDPVLLRLDLRWRSSTASGSGSCVTTRARPGFWLTACGPAPPAPDRRRGHAATQDWKMLFKVPLMGMLSGRWSGTPAAVSRHCAPVERHAVGAATRRSSVRSASSTTPRTNSKNPR